MKVVDREKTCENIKALCKANNISAKDLSEFFGVDIMSVYLWWEGKRFPTLDKLVEMSYMFGCLIDDIIIVRSM